MQSINFAIEAARALQRSQTGLIHYCHQSEDLTTHDTIPLLENALFALALFRTRLSENVLEGKGIIERLLGFEVAGNFPSYLHLFPQVLDPYLNLKLLTIFFWIVTDFGHVIGGLKQELEQCMERILSHRSAWQANWAQFRLLALEGKVGLLPQNIYDWGEGLVSLQIAEKRGAKIDEPLSAAFKLWHPELSLYIGPSLKRHQERYFPQLTLFDLFMCQWQKRFSERSEKVAPIHLYGALIRPIKEVPLYQTGAVPYVEFNSENECPLLVAWDQHTFVLAKQKHRIEQTQRELLVYPGEEWVSFYLNYHPDHQILVNGLKSNTFRQGEKLEIDSIIQLQFSAEDGTYMGHILRGNRPSQHHCKGENLFAAYDWQIAIRTIKPGNSPLKIVYTVALSDCSAKAGESTAIPIACMPLST